MLPADDGRSWWLSQKLLIMKYNKWSRAPAKKRKKTQQKANHTTHWGTYFPKERTENKEQKELDSSFYFQSSVVFCLPWINPFLLDLSAQESEVNLGNWSLLCTHPGIKYCCWVGELRLCWLIEEKIRNLKSKGSFIILYLPSTIFPWLLEL